MYGGDDIKYLGRDSNLLQDSQKVHLEVAIGLLQVNESAFGLWQFEVQFGPTIRWSDQQSALPATWTSLQSLLWFVRMATYIVDHMESFVAGCIHIPKWRSFFLERCVNDTQVVDGTQL